MDLVKRLEDIRARAFGQSSQASAQQTAQTAQVIQLPLWPEPVRAVPNGMLRSALFGAIRKGRRRYLEDEKIAAVDGVQILYTGPRLDQGDLDVWESVLHAVRTQPLGNKCHVTAYQLLRLMGKADTGGNRQVLQARMKRLVAATVTIETDRYAYTGHLVDWAAQDKDTHEWVIEVNPKLKALYEPSAYTQIDWKVRQALSGRPLAQWLHGFYASHAEPYPIKVETLWRLSGSENKTLYSFRQELREALAELQAATGWEWEIDDHDLVHVRKTKMPATQGRHLVRKILTGKKRKGYRRSTHADGA